MQTKIIRGQKRTSNQRRRGRIDKRQQRESTHWNEYQRWLSVDPARAMKAFKAWRSNRNGY